MRKKYRVYEWQKDKNGNYRRKYTHTVTSLEDIDLEWIPNTLIVICIIALVVLKVMGV